MYKNENIFNVWNKLKQEIHCKNNDAIHIKMGEIYFLSVGQNIGFETAGKGEKFLRPVLVYKKLSKNSFVGIPLTSKDKEGSYFFNFTYKNDKKSTAILSQMKVFDTKRVAYYSGNINKEDFEEIKKRVLEFMDITPKKGGGITSQKVKQRNNTEILSENVQNVNKDLYNILVTGSNGQLGSEIKELSSNYSYNFFFVRKDELDITNYDEVKSYIVKNSINTIINCAAYTKVDNAEDEIALANSINHIAVKNLATISKQNSLKLVHISTDYVFDGTHCKPYSEDDTTNPKSVYGQTKLDGENAIIDINPLNSIIIRTSWVYSFYGNNFVKTMLNLTKSRDELNVIFDQIGSPTYTKHLAKAILDILPNINNAKTQIYNYSNEGALSWYDFAKEIVKMAKIDCKINPIETCQYPTKATRPHYSLLNKAKIKSAFDIEVPYWKDGLDECLRRLGERD